MNTVQKQCRMNPSAGRIFAVLLMVSIAVITIGSLPVIAAPEQKVFSSPEEALKELVKAVKTRDKDALQQIFGPSAKDIRSSDEVQAAAEFEEFVKHVAEKTSFAKESDTKTIIYIGNENWPYPIPLVKNGEKWFFDTEAGREEILNRRIGENELTAILVCRTYVKAQREYVLKDWDGDGILAYAQKLRSDPGKKNGLFWRRLQGEPLSPLGELVAQARIEGYKKEKTVFKEEANPFHGYYFKILTRQGKSAPGGQYDYVVNGNMVGGFAFVAFPADWSQSGIMSFIVNQQGKVYQKNLGSGTAAIVHAMDSYDPDETWTPVKE